MYLVKTVSANFKAIATGGYYGTHKGDIVEFTELSLGFEVEDDDLENGKINCAAVANARHGVIGKIKGAVQHSTLINDTVSILAYSDAGISKKVNEMFKVHFEELDGVVCGSEQGMQESDNLNMDATVFADPKVLASTTEWEVIG